jgi:hypothetical protein
MKTAARIRDNRVHTIMTISMGINQDSMIVLVEFIVVGKMKKETVEINMMSAFYLSKDACST